MNFIWGSMNDMSFLTLMSLISISVPGLAQIIQAVILKFLYLDFLVTESWLLPWLTKEEDELIKQISKTEESNDNDKEKEVKIDRGINQYFD